MERVEAWFAGELLDRPPVRFARHNAEYEGQVPPAGTGNVRDRWLDSERRVESFRSSIDGRRFFGETFPVFWPNLGPDVYAAFYGCPLVFDETTSWAVPCLREKADIASLRFDADSEYLATLERMTRLALDSCRGEFLVGYTDLHPGIDTAAAWRGTEALFLDLYDDPDFARELLDLAGRDFASIYGQMDSVLKSAGQLSVTWMGIPAAGRMHVPSCDIASMISTAHFDRYVLPEIERECAIATHNIFHIDGSGVARHLDRLLELPGIGAYQWVQGFGEEEPIMRWIPLIDKIRARGKGVVVNLKTSELDPFMDALDPRGLYLCMEASSDEEELAVIGKLERWAGKNRTGRKG
jgi:hypothetical protein